MSCPCVKGYAQRDYEKLSEYLQKALGQPVQIHFSETLNGALKTKTQGKADIVIGKKSCIASDAKANEMKLQPLVALSGKDGRTTQTGLFVVAFDDPGKMILPPLIYLGLHVLESQVATPNILGRRLSISPLVMLLWLMLWGWLWGVAGLLLAVPMLACVKITADRVERWHGWARLIG